MAGRLRGAAQGGRDLALYAVRTGRWWMPVLLLVLAGVVLLAAATQTVVPTAVYTLF